MASVMSQGRGAPFLRLLVALLAILCTATCYLGRQNLSLAIIAMVSRKEDASSSDPEMQTYGPKYPWTIGTIPLQAFFYPYVAMQVPGARLAEILGPKWILFNAGFATALLSGLSPWLASIDTYGQYLFSGLRVVLGICQASIFPACYVILTNWLPLVERSIALPFMNLSAFFGGILAMKATGYFNSEPSLGWPWAFYLPALVCSLWSVAWLSLASSAPHEHSCITPGELEYIEKNKGDVKSSSKQLSWSRLFRSRQIWATIAAFFSSNWSFCLILQCLPTYLNYMQGIPMRENSDINVNMYIIFCITAPLIGYASSCLVESRLISRIWVRKLFQSICTWGQGAVFLVLANLGHDPAQVKSLLYLLMLSYSFVNGGECHLPTEISAEFGGTIYAIANSVGSMNGFLLPLVQDLMVSELSDQTQWQRFLYVAAGVSFFGNLLFVVMGDNKPEDFSVPHEPQDLELGDQKLVAQSKKGKLLEDGPIRARVEFTETDKLSRPQKNYNSTSPERRTDEPTKTKPDLKEEATK